jgi:transposase InsO family protein
VACYWDTLSAVIFALRTRTRTRDRAPCLRDECLNDSWFLTLADARRIIEAWRQDYNLMRPHSALGYLTPDEFKRMHRNGAERTPE